MDERGVGEVGGGVHSNGKRDAECGPTMERDREKSRRKAEAGMANGTQEGGRKTIREGQNAGPCECESETPSFWDYSNRPVGPGGEEREGAGRDAGVLNSNQ